MLIALKSLYNMAVYYKHHNKVMQGRAETSRFKTMEQENRNLHDIF